MSHRVPALMIGLLLGLHLLGSPASAFQAPKEAPPKEVTDGFFTVPPRDPSEETQPWGLPAYMLTTTLGAGAIFILCKSARRG
jgi:hypothetical protein